MAVLFLAIDELESFDKATERMAVAGVEGRQGVLQNAGVLAGEAFADEFFELGDVEIEHFGR